MTRSRGVIGGVVVLILTLLGALTWIQGRSTPGPPPRPSTANVPTGSGQAPAGTADLPLVASTHADGTYDATLIHEPTAGPAQSKLWFAEGTWWGTLVDPATQELHIGRLDPTTQGWTDTGTLVDERLHVRADTVWDGRLLTIVSAGNKPTASQAARISQFHYDRASGRFVIDPDLPVTVTRLGVDDPVLARDSTGVLWLTYVDQTRLVLRHTLGDALHWSPAAAPPMAGTVGATRTVALIADGTHVILVWNRQDDETLQVGEHVDGADLASWTTVTTTVAGLRNAPGGLSIRSAHTSAGTRLFIAFETAPDLGPNANPLAPGAIVMILGPNGTWTNVQLARVKDHFNAPTLAIDDAHGTVFAIAAVGSSGTIVYKQAPVDQVSFDSGRGTDLIASSLNPRLRNPTTTKQAVDVAAGLVVLGADDGTGRYVHGVLSTAAAGPSDGPEPSTPLPSNSPPPVPADTVTILLHDTFDPWAIGTRSPADWVASPQGGGAGRLSVVGVPSPTRHSLRLDTTSVSGSVRACKSFAPTAAGSVTVTELVRLAGVGTSDATLGSVRGPGGEAASVRITRHRLLAYYDGQTKVTTAVLVRTGVWYRSTIVIRLATHTYDWIVADPTGRVIARIRDIHWRQAAIPAMDTVCAQAPQGRGAAILLDDVEVRR